MTKKRSGEKSAAKIILITLSLLFVAIMLVFPLAAVLINALRQGLLWYFSAISTDYVISALKVTLIAAGIALLVNTFFGLSASWLLTRFIFRGRSALSALIDIPFSISPVIAGLAFIMTFGRTGFAHPILEWVNDFLGTDIKLVFSVPGVVLATIFVTFPFVFREIVPVLNSLGKDQEEAAALMGAGAFCIFKKITFPQIRWAFLYGVILCAARALGEFGAVAALSKTRGETFTLPLEIDALYMSGSADAIYAAFAVSSVLVILAVVLLILRSVVEQVMGRGNQ